MENSKQSSRLLERIDKARREIQKYGGYEDFIHYVISKYGHAQGITKSNISNIKRRLQKTRQPPQEKDFIVVELLERELHQFADTSRPSKSAFYRTSWYLYFFHKVKRDSNPEFKQAHVGSRVGLGRVVLEIDKLGVVTLLNIKDGISADYRGTFQLVNDYVLFFDLYATSGESKLHLKVLTKKEPEQIHLGIYLSFESQSIISGSAILELQSRNRKTPSDSILSPGFFTYRTKEFDVIPLEIRRFLSLKMNNHLTMPKMIFSKIDLDYFMKSYIRDKQSLSFDYSFPRVYFSAQIESIGDPEQYMANQQAIVSIKEDTVKLCREAELIIKIDYPGSLIHKNQDLNRHTFAPDLDSLRSIKYFVLFLTNDNASRSLLELGAALMVCKCVLVLYNVDFRFPERLSTLGESSAFKVYRMFPYYQSIHESRAQLVNQIVNLIKDNP